MSFPCWFWDYDDDGWLDIFVSGYTLDFSRKTLEDLVRDMLGLPCAVDKPRLYRNRGDGTFQDVTSAARIRDTGWGHGCAVGDIDNDGDPDLYLTNRGPNALFRNNGNGTFTEMPRAGGATPFWSIARSRG